MLWAIPTAVFWSSLGLVAYTYVGYPLLVGALAWLRPRGVRRAAIEPSVSIVLAVHDEERHVGRKLENLLALDYPSEKLQVVVADDGSRDRTRAIVEERRARDPRVALVSLESSQGKAAAINQAMQRARGEVVLFCDARQRVHPRALRALVPYFADPQLGAVSGELVLEGEKGPGMYWAYEKRIRAAEGKVDSVVGATGALFAIRRHLFRPLPEGTLLDDVFTPMQIVLQGYRVQLEPEAKVYDMEADLGGEFARKARTLAGNFQLLGLLPELLHPGKNRLFVQFVSHKLLRLVCPFALGALLCSNVALVATGAPPWPLYVATLAGQLLGYGLAARGAWSGGEAGRAARLSHTFVVLNLAAVEGLRRYVAGELRWTSART